MRGPASGSRTTGLQRRPPRSRGAPLYPPARNRAWPADSELQPTRLLVPVERVPQPFFQARGRAEAKLAAGAAGVADPTCAAGFRSDSELQPTRLLVPVERVPQPFFQARGRAEAKLAAGAAGVADPTCAAGFQHFVARQDARLSAEARPPLGA